MKKIILILSLPFLLVSCQSNEKELIGLSLKVKTEKTLLHKQFEDNELSLETLGKLKSYGDNLSYLVAALEKNSKSKRNRKKIKKYLLKSKRLDSLCSTYLLNDELYFNLKSNCNEGFFNICPLSFSSFVANKERLVKTLGLIFGKELSDKTDCKSFIGEVR